MTAILLSACSGTPQGDELAPDAAPVQSTSTATPTVADPSAVAVERAAVNAGLDDVDVTCVPTPEPPAAVCVISSATGTGSAQVLADGRVELLGVVDVDRVVGRIATMTGRALPPSSTVTCERRGVVIVADDEVFRCTVSVDGASVPVVVRGDDDAADGWIVVDESTNAGLDAAVLAAQRIDDLVAVRSTGLVDDAIVWRDALLESSELASLALDDFGLSRVVSRTWPSLSIVHGLDAAPNAVSMASGVADRSRPPGVDNPYWVSVAFADVTGRCAAGVVFLAESHPVAAPVDPPAGPCNAVAMIVTWPPSE